MFIVKLAMFPFIHAPRPYETLRVTFKTIDDAVAEGKKELAAITEQELAAIGSSTHPRSSSLSNQNPARPWLTAIDMSSIEVHGLLVFDQSGTEVFNWTTWDEAVERASSGRA